MPDEDARLLRELHDQHAQAVWRYVVHLTGDRAMADTGRIPTVSISTISSR